MLSRWNATLSFSELARPVWLLPLPQRMLALA
jgi:hypothetical protein